MYPGDQLTDFVCSIKCGEAGLFCCVRGNMLLVGLGSDLAIQKSSLQSFSDMCTTQQSVHLIYIPLTLL